MIVLKISALIVCICFFLTFGLLLFCKFAPTKKNKFFLLIGKHDYFKGSDIFCNFIKILIIIGLIAFALCVLYLLGIGLLTIIAWFKNSKRVLYLLRYSFLFKFYSHLVPSYEIITKLLKLLIRKRKKFIECLLLFVPVMWYNIDTRLRDTRKESGS